MRLHRLTLTAVGPFATEQVVDFDHLGSGGLFLLDGPTGAGKTTVLDAITFALYGAPANNGDGRLHSDFADRATTPEVCLEFSLDGVRHRVTRTPQHERPKLRGEGVTTVAASAHLERFESGRWVSRSSNKAEVAEMLAEVVGLTREQFTQVVLLPQGQFATFLRASDDERRALLTKLFGTQLYDRITDELDRRRQSATRDLDAAQQRVVSAVAAAAEAAGADEAALLDAGPEGRAVLLAELTAGLRARSDAAREAAGVASAGCATARAAHALAEADADRRRRFRQLVAERAAHEAGLDDHERTLQALADGRRAEPVAVLLRAVDDARAAVAVAREGLAALDAGDAEVDAGAASPESRAREATTAAAELQHLVDREPEVDDLRRAVAAAEAVRATAAEAIAAIDARRDALPGELDAADTDLQRLRGLAADLSAASARREELARRVDAARALAELAPRLADAVAARAAAVDAAQAAVDTHQSLVERRLAGMAAELAGQLAAGEPCAVCGSAEHPAPARAAADAVSADDLATAADRRTAAEAERTRRDGELADLQRRESALVAVAGGADATELDRDLDGELVEATARVRAAEAAAAELPAAEDRVTGLRAELDRLAADRAEAAQHLARAEADLDRDRQQLADLSAALDEARAGCVSVAARQQQLRADAERCTAVAAAVRTLAAATEVAAEAVARAGREAQDAGFASLEAAAGAVLAPPRRDALQAQADDWSDRSRRLDAALGADEFAGLDPAAADDTPDLFGDALDRAQLELADAERRAADAAREADLAAHAVERFAVRAAELAEADAEHARRRAEAEPVLYLSKLTKGMAGQRRVALTTYVLRHWFEQVVAAANVRLISISAGRYELIRVDEGGSKAERSGLTLQVVDRHTGEARSPRSLSGGETFYTSLALALGLADVVRAEAGGVDLDTLFIDEGFGTLDAETLDQVMAVIDDLRDRGRVVGIVSHVADLKDRIPERLEVRRLPDGSSTLRVVA